MEDTQIIDLFFCRKESAISEVTIKYGTYIRSIAYSILGNPSDSEECENDTYIAAWNTIPPTRPKLLKTYLGRLCRNIACDRYDYQKAKKRNRDFDLVLSELEEIISAPERQWDYEDGFVAKQISEFLYSVPQQQRAMFVRRYWHNTSIKELAMQFHVNENTVKSTLFRLRKKLKNFLEKKGVLL